MFWYFHFSTTRVSARQVKEIGNQGTSSMGFNPKKRCYGNDVLRAHLKMILGGL